MPSSFTHYWSETTQFEQGAPFDHTAGNRFIRSGVTTGDRVFGISVRRGVPILVGRLVAVSSPVTYDDACTMLPYEPWEADEHIIAAPGTASEQSEYREIPLEILQHLRFHSPGGETALKFVSKTRLDQQTFRGVRRLTDESAELLESLIESPPAPDLSPTYPDEIDTNEPYLEGARRSVTVNAYERDPAARLACIQHYGCSCFVCGFDFADYYGDLGEGFIHVHHRRPIAECGGEYVVDPIADLIPVCPNCHAMLHRGTTPPSVEDLSQIYDEHVIENDDEQSAGDNGS